MTCSGGRLAWFAKRSIFHTSPVMPTVMPPVIGQGILQCCESLTAVQQSALLLA
ncbi:hypothetical protein LF1_51730 [Rubripirellula obstinata]|uniref:Uncharacterized protein n=1 Tax=Rubripirellula obstinata TaxID=406547 RepID=A0A5B1CPV3_9BACT|nr:hypothetical protein LF1_51730 [Rubripirellula obstinata]